MGLVCDWLVTVKVRGALVVCVTCKNKLKTKLKTHDKATATVKITTTITITKRITNC
jgi:ABC-type Zn uptake system ZnuABC Zn-binding protein ZnuA